MKDFEPVGYGYGRGREQLYCSLQCKTKRNLEKHQEKRCQRYGELKNAGANSYQANFGSKSILRYQQVLDAIKK